MCLIRIEAINFYMVHQYVSKNAFKTEVKASFDGLDDAEFIEKVKIELHVHTVE